MTTVTGVIGWHLYADEVRMGYIVKKVKNGWSVVHRHDDGKKVKERKIPLDSAEARQLGISPDFSLKMALEALEHVRRSGVLTEELERARKLRHAAKMSGLRAIVWLPPHLIEEFERTTLRFITIRKEKWELAKQLIAGFKSPPEEWHLNALELYDLFITRAYSTYTCRIYLKLINGWGNFYCSRFGKSYIPIPRMDYQTRFLLARSRQEKNKDKVTEPLLPEHIERAKIVLPPLEYNGLVISYYFGLRPEELLWIRSNRPSNNTWYIELEKEGRPFPWALAVFQDKLRRRGTPRARCWKVIPAVLPEQQELRNILETGDFKEVTYRLLKVVNKGLILKSARAGFANMMNIQGYGDRCIQMWMGRHLGDIQSKHYIQRRMVWYEPPKR